MSIDVATTDPRDELAERLLAATTSATEVLHVYLGDRLGLYAALHTTGAATSQQLAAAAGIDERYAREWLEQQAVAGMLDVVQDGGDPWSRCYRLPEGAADVLVDRDSLYYLAPLGRLVAGIAQALPQVLEAFRTGGGVPYAAYGPDMRHGIAELNRPGFLQQLATDWLPALPDVEARLRQPEPAARVADLGCGSGWSCIALAAAFPSAFVDGVDLDEASVEEARRHAAEHALQDRVTFHQQSASQPLPGPYDLVTLFETLHDMADPVEVLRAARTMVAGTGAVLVGDERVAEQFTAPGDDLERFNYGWSALHCLPAARLAAGAEGTGTVMRPDDVRRFAREAGFRSTTVLPVEHDFWRFYRLDP